MGNSKQSSQNSQRSNDISERNQNVQSQTIQNNIMSQQQIVQQQQQFYDQRRNDNQPTTSQPVTQTKTIKNLVNIKRNSIELTKHSTLPNILYLTFQFDSKLPCIINIYLMAQEVIDQNNNFTNYFNVDLSRYPQPLGYKFNQGLNQIFPQNVFPIDLNVCKESDLEVVDSYAFKYPLVIEMKVDKSVGTDQSHTQLTYGVFKREAGELTVKVFQQKILVGQDKSYLICEIYGCQQTIQEMAAKQTKQSDEEIQNNGKECVICFTEKKDTAVLPCRHMCLCADCANILRRQINAKCPICRKNIESLFQIKISDKNEKHQNNQKQQSQKQSVQKQQQSENKTKRSNDPEDSII